MTVQLEVEQENDLYEVLQGVVDPTQVHQHTHLMQKKLSTKRPAESPPEVVEKSLWTCDEKDLSGPGRLRSCGSSLANTPMVQASTRDIGRSSVILPVTVNLSTLPGTDVQHPL